MNEYSSDNISLHYTCMNNINSDTVSITDCLYVQTNTSLRYIGIFFTLLDPTQKIIQQMQSFFHWTMNTAIIYFNWRCFLPTWWESLNIKLNRENINIGRVLWRNFRFSFGFSFAIFSRIFLNLNLHYTDTAVIVCFNYNTYEKLWKCCGKPVKRTLQKLCRNSISFVWERSHVSKKWCAVYLFTCIALIYFLFSWVYVLMFWPAAIRRCIKYIIITFNL